MRICDRCESKQSVHEIILSTRNISEQSGFSVELDLCNQCSQWLGKTGIPRIRYEFLNHGEDLSDLWIYD